MSSQANGTRIKGDNNNNHSTGTNQKLKSCTLVNFNETQLFNIQAALNANSHPPLDDPWNDRDD